MAGASDRIVPLSTAGRGEAALEARAAAGRPLLWAVVVLAIFVAGLGLGLLIASRPAPPPVAAPPPQTPPAPAAQAAPVQPLQVQPLQAPTPQVQPPQAPPAQLPPSAPAAEPVPETSSLAVPAPQTPPGPATAPPLSQGAVALPLPDPSEGAVQGPPEALPPPPGALPPPPRLSMPAPPADPDRPPSLEDLARQIEQLERLKSLLDRMDTDEGLALPPQPLALPDPAMLPPPDPPSAGEGVPPPAPAVRDDDIPYAIQVGTFTDWDAAAALVRRLADQGLSARAGQLRGDPDAAPRYVVQVGPIVGRRAARATLSTLQGQGFRKARLIDE